MDTIVRERIAELLCYRRWFRENRWADWPPLRHEYDVELRALLRLARQGRAVQRGAAAEADAGNHYVFPEPVVDIPSNLGESATWTDR